jgi:hypothetical protein
MSEPYFCENYIDIFCVSHYKLAVYPLYLVFGRPIFDINSQKVKFPSQTSLKIQENCLSEWLYALHTITVNFFEDQNLIGQKVIYSDTPIEEENKEDLENRKQCFFYEIKHSEDASDLKIRISSTYSAAPVHFLLDSSEILEFVQAFSAIFFKLYCYSPTQNLCIENFVKTENSGFILECTLYEVFLHLRAQALLPLSVSECMRTAELIIRHKEIIIKWKKLAVLL